jgi:hypothetical protein
VADTAAAPAASSAHSDVWDLHYNLHVTINPDGITTSDPENLVLTCR